MRFDEADIRLAFLPDVCQSNSKRQKMAKAFRFSQNMHNQ